MFLQKNERTNSTLQLVDLFSFLFWKKVKSPEKHFEIFKEMCFKIATSWNSKKTLLKCIKTEKNKQYISCEILRFMKSEY